MAETQLKVKTPMTKWDKIRLTLATIGLLVCVGALIYISRDLRKSDENYIKVVNYVLRMTKEQGYAEGQAAAMKGEIRIIKVNDTTYVWASAPFGNKYPIKDTIYVKR